MISSRILDLSPALNLREVLNEKKLSCRRPICQWLARGGFQIISKVAGEYSVGFSDLATFMEVAQAIGINAEKQRPRLAKILYFNNLVKSVQLFFGFVLFARRL